MLRRINPILPEFLGFLLLYGLLVQAIGIWFVEDKLSYTISLWVGIAMAAGMLVHMAVMILDVVDIRLEKQAKLKTALSSILRYLVVAGIFMLVAYLGLGNIFAMWLGVAGVKAGAFLYAFSRKFISKSN